MEHKQVRAKPMTSCQNVTNFRILACVFLLRMRGQEDPMVIDTLTRLVVEYTDLVVAGVRERWPHESYAKVAAFVEEDAAEAVLYHLRQLPESAEDRSQVQEMLLHQVLEHLRPRLAAKRGRPCTPPDIIEQTAVLDATGLSHKEIARQLRGKYDQPFTVQAVRDMLKPRRRAKQ